MAKVTWRCQPVQERTSYWSRPTSPLASSKQLSMVQRLPGTCTRWASVVVSGAWQPGPVVEARPLGAAPGAEPLPAVGRPLGQPLLDRHQTEPLSGGDRQH